MYKNNSNGSRVAWARGFIGLWTALVMGLGLVASPAEAAPFAYVTNSYSNIVSVIATATKITVCRELGRD
jgi:DNA-binding beta-propeller fold protein YncE